MPWGLLSPRHTGRADFPHPAFPDTSRRRRAQGVDGPPTAAAGQGRPNAVDRWFLPGGGRAVGSADTNVGSNARAQTSRSFRTPAVAVPPGSTPSNLPDAG